MSNDRRVPVVNGLSAFRVLMGFLMFLGGCLSGETAPVTDWAGLHQDELIKMMGPPTERVLLPGGKVQLVFDHGRLDQRTGTHESWTCRMYFETDRAGFIQRVFSSGCRTP